MLNLEIRKRFSVVVEFPERRRALAVCLRVPPAVLRGGRDFYISRHLDLFLLKIIGVSGLYLQCIKPLVKTAQGF